MRARLLLHAELLEQVLVDHNGLRNGLELLVGHLERGERGQVRFPPNQKELASDSGITESAQAHERPDGGDQLFGLRTSVRFSLRHDTAFYFAHSLSDAGTGHWASSSTSATRTTSTRSRRATARG